MNNNFDNDLMKFCKTTVVIFVDNLLDNLDNNFDNDLMKLCKTTLDIFVDNLADIVGGQFVDNLVGNSADIVVQFWR